MDMVWVVGTHNRFGLGVSAHETRELAVADLYREVKEHWDRYLQDPIPADPEEAIELFYEEPAVASQSWYNLSEVPIERAPPA